MQRPHLLVGGVEVLRDRARPGIRTIFSTFDSSNDKRFPGEKLLKTLMLAAHYTLASKGINHNITRPCPAWERPVLPA